MNNQNIINLNNQNKGKIEVLKDLILFSKTLDYDNSIKVLEFVTNINKNLKLV
tara:strand:+ start:467 stop:625 length:159 start_codon:yes stop_codon:yes gene_type:complete